MGNAERASSPAPALANGSSPGAFGAFGHLRPLRFEPNEGQVDPEVRFVARPGGAALFLTAEGAVLSSPRAAVRLRVDGGRRVEPRASVELATRSSYLLGSEPSRWRTAIPSFGRVTYSSVLDGVDLVFHGEEGQLEYDFVVAPGKDPEAIALEVDGATSLSLRADGGLAIQTPVGELIQPKPRVYQRDEHGVERDVVARYRVDGTKVAFAFDRYDVERELVIDPVLEYGALLGSGGETNSGIAVDGDGNVYLTGRTNALDFPTVLPLQASKQGVTDAFVLKMNPQGTALVWATYLGGTDSDNGAAIDVDTVGNVYVAGDTTSNDFPTTPGAFQTSRVGLADAFAVKIAASGTELLYSTLLGGSATDEVRGVRVDADGRAHVVGETVSTNFPTFAPHQPTFGGGTADVFITTVDASGSGLAFSTYLGGSGEDRAPSVALDSAGNTVIAGWTFGTFPVTTGAFQTAKKGIADAYVAKVGPTGNLAWSTYLGGVNADHAYGVAVDADDRIYVAGVTASPDFPTKGSIQPYVLADAFVTKLEPSGSALVWSTFFGGPVDDQVRGSIAVDARGCVAFGGSTQSTTGFPLLNAVQNTHAGGSTDGFVAKLNATGSVVVFATYLGSSAADVVKGIAMNAAGDVYAMGETGSHTFPSTPPFQR
ncbi:MAG: hypothetical protein K0S65_1248, partial [Labilithrix sp.]|nr:hypothetical protein [Labilithrix sp.]